MSPGQVQRDPKLEAAIAELKGMIQARHSDAIFNVRTGIEDPEETWLTARVDIDDPDKVMDIVLNRVVELQLDEGIPIFVLPLRTPRRTSALKRRLEQEKRKASSLPQVLP